MLSHDEQRLGSIGGATKPVKNKEKSLKLIIAPDRLQLRGCMGNRWNKFRKIGNMLK